MAEIIIFVDLPIGSANDIDTTELALLLRDVKAANIIDYVDSERVEVTPIGEPDYANQQYFESEGY
jgi:hypothetical protein